MCKEGEFNKDVLNTNAKDQGSDLGKRTLRSSVTLHQAC